MTTGMRMFDDFESGTLRGLLTREIEAEKASTIPSVKNVGAIKNALNRIAYLEGLRDLVWNLTCKYETSDKPRSRLSKFLWG